VSVEDNIRATVNSYLERFTAGDREGWLDLFAPDATVEDPVGTPIKRGRDAIGEFWDSTRGAIEIALKMVQGPGVRGNEAAWAMEAHTKLGDSSIIAPTIDVMTFDDDGRITVMRAFWSEGDAREA